MGKPGKKLKKIFLILGITGAVYGGFKYLLPLVAVSYTHLTLPTK